MKLTTAAQMKELDRQAIEERGIPSIDLMERAAAGVAEAALALLPKRPGKCRGGGLVRCGQQRRRWNRRSPAAVFEGAEGPGVPGRGL